LTESSFSVLAETEIKYADLRRNWNWVLSLGQKMKPKLPSQMFSTGTAHSFKCYSSRHCYLQHFFRYV